MDDSVRDSDRWEQATDVGESFFPSMFVVVVVVMGALLLLEWT